MHIMLYIILLPMYVHIPTPFVYGCLILRVAFVLRTFPLSLDLFEYDSQTGHFMKLECCIILTAHAAHPWITFGTPVHFHTVTVSYCPSTFHFTIQYLLPCLTNFHNLSVAFLLRHSRFAQARNLPASGLM